MGAIAAAAIAAIGTGYSIYSTEQAKSKAEEDAKKAQGAKAEALAGQQEALQGLFDSQQDPVEIFKDIFTQFPDLLGQVLPSLTTQSIDASSKLTDANVASYLSALSKLTPDYQRLRADQVHQIDNMNPDNLGAEEIAAITKKASPLLPSGTLDPKTGAVAGGTTNPASLYRNLISGEYQRRRTDFLNADSQFLTGAENSAARQQVQSQNFLLPLLSIAANSAAGISTSVERQQSQNIATQAGLLQSVLSIPDAQFNPLQFSSAESSAIQSGTGSIAYLLNAIDRNGKTTKQNYPSTTAAAPTGTTSYAASTLSS